MEDLIRKSSELNPFAEETRPFKKKPTSKEKRDRDQEKSLLNQRSDFLFFSFFFEKIDQ